MTVSILSPVRNEERAIREMLDSVQAQTNSDWELLVVDDGSTDSTAQIVSDYAARDPRIHLVSSGIRLGKVKAFNLAFVASSGDVVMMLSGDDRLPSDSLATRAAAFAGASTSERVLATFKFRTFSTHKSFDGMLLPRGRATSLSGGILTMNRRLCDEVFPIPEDLPTEDLWLGEAAVALADTHHRGQEVVLEYRMHEGNSNPRMRSFDEMSQSIAVRHEAYRVLARAQSLGVDDDRRAAWYAIYKVELLRRKGRTLRILLSSDVPLMRRLSMAGMSRRVLWGVRRRFYRAFSGWQGR